MKCYQCGKDTTTFVWKARCASCTSERVELLTQENEELRERLSNLEGDMQVMVLRRTALAKEVDRN